MSESDKKLYCKYCKGEILEFPAYCRTCFKSLEEYKDFKALRAYVNEVYKKEQKSD